MEVVRLIRAACAAKKARVRRTMEPITDAAAMTMRTTVLLVTRPFPGHVCKKEHHINS